LCSSYPWMCVDIYIYARLSSIWLVSM
jgi:hypothetical protein